MEALVKVINRIFLRKQKPFDRTQKANSISVGRKRGGGGAGALLFLLHFPIANVSLKLHIEK